MPVLVMSVGCNQQKISKQIQQAEETYANMAFKLLCNFDTDEILGWSPVRFAEETEHWESVELILIEGAPASDLAATKRKLQESERAAAIFSELCRRRLVRLLSFALQESPGLVRAQLPLHRSPLHEAARSGCPATVRCLVSAGAAINVADDHGMTPIHEAAAHSNDYAVRILLDAGADFEATDNGGRSALHYASRSGSVSCIQLLLAKGATVDRISADGCTALHEAATSPSAHALRLLLDAGADKHATSAAGWTALHWAASRGRLYAIMLLLEAGLPVDAKTVNEETPLHLAATLASTDVWEALVSAGADEGAVDKNGRTPKERAVEISAPAVVRCDSVGRNTSDVSVDQSRVAPGPSNDSSFTSNDSEELSAENSTIQFSSAPLNSTALQAVTTTQESEETHVTEHTPSVPGQTANNKSSSLTEASNNSINVAEEQTAENLTLCLSSMALNSITQQTITDSQEGERASVECMSVASGQRTDSVCSSLCEEYSELGDESESDSETDSGEQSESTEESYSGDETASDEETGSDDETGSDTDVEDCSSYISSANEEIDKSSERGSVNESSSPVMTTNTALFYEGPPLFNTLGTVGTSSKYNQTGTKYQGTFRGRGRGAPRGSRGKAAAYTTKSVPRKEYATEPSQSQGSGRHCSNIEKGIRKGNFDDSVPQLARGQGDVNCSQPNAVLYRGGIDQSYTGAQRGMNDDYRNKETHVAENKQSKKTRHSKSLSQQQGDSKVKHKKTKQSDYHHGEGHQSKSHGEGHHSKRHGEGHHSKRHGEGHHSKRQGEGHHSKRQGEGHHSKRHGEGHHSKRHGEGHHSKRHGEGHSGNQHGLVHYGNQHSEGYHSSQHTQGHHSNQQGVGVEQTSHILEHNLVQTMTIETKKLIWQKTRNAKGQIHHGESHNHNQHVHHVGHFGNQHGEAHFSNQYGGSYHSNQYGEGRHANGHYANRQGRGGNWHRGGRGGNSHAKS